MKRLTLEELNSFIEGSRREGKTIISKALNELKEYKKIEKELGCSLDVLKPNQKVSFIKDNIIYDDIEVMGINIQNKEIMLGSSWSFTSLPLNLYGRTWWLKEDKSK